MEPTRDKCKNNGRNRITAGIILTGVGLVFLLGNVDIIPPIGDTWPLLLVVVGAALFFGATRERRNRESTPPPDESPSAPA